MLHFQIMTYVTAELFPLKSFTCTIQCTIQCKNYFGWIMEMPVTQYHILEPATERLILWDLINALAIMSQIDVLKWLLLISKHIHSLSNLS